MTHEIECSDTSSEDDTTVEDETLSDDGVLGVLPFPNKVDRDE